jgi:hypothetical protein
MRIAGPVTARTSPSLWNMTNAARDLPTIGAWPVIRAHLNRSRRDVSAMSNAAEARKPSLRSDSVVNC